MHFNDTSLRPLREARDATMGPDASSKADHAVPVADLSQEIAAVGSAQPIVHLNAASCRPVCRPIAAVEARSPSCISTPHYAVPSLADRFGGAVSPSIITPHDDEVRRRRHFARWAGKRADDGWCFSQDSR